MTARQNRVGYANAAQRCQHIHLSGRRCGSPALAGRRLCYFHAQTRRPQRPNYDLPLLEDATAVQFALTQVVRALQDKALDTKTCALLLYALQTASANLKRLAEERQRAAEAEPSEPDPNLAAIVLRELGLDPASVLGDDRAGDSVAGEKGDSDAAREMLRGPQGRSA